MSPVFKEKSDETLDKTPSKTRTEELNTRIYKGIIGIANEKGLEFTVEGKRLSLSDAIEKIKGMEDSERKSQAFENLCNQIAEKWRMKENGRAYTNEFGFRYNRLTASPKRVMKEMRFNCLGGNAILALFLSKMGDVCGVNIGTRLVFVKNHDGNTLEGHVIVEMSISEKGTTYFDSTAAFQGKYRFKEKRKDEFNRNDLVIFVEHKRGGEKKEHRYIIESTSMIYGEDAIKFADVEQKLRDGKNLSEEDVEMLGGSISTIAIYIGISKGHNRRKLSEYALSLWRDKFLVPQEEFPLLVSILAYYDNLGTKERIDIIKRLEEIIKREGEGDEEYLGSVGQQNRVAMIPWVAMAIMKASREANRIRNIKWRNEIDKGRMALSYVLFYYINVSNIFTKEFTEEIMQERDAIKGIIEASKIMAIYFNTVRINRIKTVEEMRSLVDVGAGIGRMYDLFTYLSYTGKHLRREKKETLRRAAGELRKSLRKLIQDLGVLEPDIDKIEKEGRREIIVGGRQQWIIYRIYRKFWKKIEQVIELLELLKKTAEGEIGLKKAKQIAHQRREEFENAGISLEKLDEVNERNEMLKLFATVIVKRLYEGKSPFKYIRTNTITRIMENIPLPEGVREYVEQTKDEIR